MDAFVGELRSRLPSLQITTVADSSEMIFLSYDSPELKLLQQETRIPLGVSPGAFVRRLFKDTARVSDGERLLSELFAIASDMQDIEDLDISLYDLFAEEEMTALYAWNCAKMFHQNGTGAASRDIPARCAANLWRNIVDEADEAIASGRPYVNLRFGHDTALYRLLSLLRASLREDNAKGTVENPLDEIVPMAANLQMIFCHDRAGRVTVGFFLNEKPACLHGLCPVVRTPGGTDWYMWDEVKVRYRSYIDGQR